ncbi:helix-turn-helix domain-containing protein [Gracilinema caldarium]|uniref:Helix-turn-helix domain protein n=1 Tax=Gracilinema caldarium (strain ATCC 51460 / DSM 7334 / H1) TaxID=744872 RepID=F8F356_GRAC1|nr:helix-turn-helix transcriptional regulator [Gracilinema caldarium]AEJ20382.1 helix-turn-helix domain protein [Gracilinema caldarium DSM 7334]
MMENELLNLLGHNIRQTRIEKGLSQYGLALKTGMAANSINDIENGKRWVSAKSLSRIANALEVEPYIFLLPKSFRINDGITSIKLYDDEMIKAIQSAIKEVRKRYNIDSDS